MLSIRYRFEGISNILRDDDKQQTQVWSIDDGEEHQTELHREEFVSWNQTLMMLNMSTLCETVEFNIIQV
jgi:hypothetical protein